ncbi:MAG: DUF433 domain-containing protein [Sphingobacteriaceae bacterium]|nr:MAG: DUF433 domain-containing protein [Sphingobacteriaceae bacterium]
MSKLSDFINVDPNIMSGKPVFKRTRVPVQSLFWYLREGISIQEFLKDFPSVSLKQVEGVIAWGADFFESSKSILDETVIR